MVEKNGVFASCCGLCQCLFPAMREGKQWSQKNDTSFCAKQAVVFSKTTRCFQNSILSSFSVYKICARKEEANLQFPLSSHAAGLDLMANSYGVQFFSLRAQCQRQCLLHLLVDYTQLYKFINQVKNAMRNYVLILYCYFCHAMQNCQIFLE